MDAVAKREVADIVAYADPSSEIRASAREVAPDAVALETFEELLAADLDGVVIATPSALHAAQSVAALERGFAVFCQKPLGRDGRETRAVVDAAARANRLLGVDLSYRFTEALQKVRSLVQSGELGRIYAADLVFHNAYGPDKPWFYQRHLSGGGCVIDLGIHLVDAVLWVLGFPAVNDVHSRLFASGVPLSSTSDEVEDYAVAELGLEGGAVARLACSWRLQAGQDAVISVELYGTAGGVALRNVDGSFYDFVGERFRGTSRERMASPPDAWGGRAIVDWATKLATDARFDPEAQRLVELARVLDRIYGR